MKLRKILAALTATALCVGVAAVSASAAIVNGNGSEWSEGDGKYIFDIKKEAGDNYTNVIGVVVDISVAGAEEGFGGGIAFVSGFNEAAWPGFIEWGSEDADKPIVSDGKTIEYRSDKPIFTSSDAPVIVMLEAWWGGDITVNGIKLEYSGGVVPTETAVTTVTQAAEEIDFDDDEVDNFELDEADVSNADADDAVEGTPSAPTGNTTVAAIIGLMAVAGVAALATKKRK
ncbi:MAG: hypothetical protein FWG90_00375 [Oscillospiraceae bacterium]|nr:hypothetical protein [Oscillospiraceae bacterium]